MRPTLTRRKLNGPTNYSKKPKFYERVATECMPARVSGLVCGMFDGLPRIEEVRKHMVARIHSEFSLTTKPTHHAISRKNAVVSVR